MFLGSILVDRSTWQLGIATRYLSCLPNEVLQQVALVLYQQQQFGLFDNVAHVSHQCLAFSRKLGGRACEWFGGDGGVESNVDLFILHTR